MYVLGCVQGREREVRYVAVVRARQSSPNNLSIGQRATAVPEDVLDGGCRRNFGGLRSLAKLLVRVFCTLYSGRL